MKQEYNPNSETPTSSRTAYIVGAGFSGLTLAYYLVESGHQIEIFERDRKIGGLLQSKKLRHGIAETAANAFLCSKSLEDMAQKIGVPLVPVLSSAKKRFIWRRGKARTWPLNVIESVWLALRLFILPFREGPKNLESVQSWGYRCLGKQATDKIVCAGLQGIYAGDPTRMSARLIILKFWQAFKNRKKKAPTALHGSVAPLDGMGAFLQKLSEYLLQKGVKIHQDAELDALSLNALYKQSLANKGRLYLCTPPPEASQLLAQVDPKVSALLSQVEMIPVLTATMIYPKHSKKFQGFGCLFPRNEGFRVLGILMNSEIFPNRSAEHSETWIFHDDFENETEALDCVRVERKKIFQEEATPLEFKVTRWPRGIPHYSIQLESLLAKGLQEKLSKKHITLHGNYLGDLGLTRILERSKSLVQESMS